MWDGGSFLLCFITHGPPSTHLGTEARDASWVSGMFFFSFLFLPANVTNSRYMTSSTAHPQLTLYTSEDLAEPRSTEIAQTTQNTLFEPFSKFYFILFVTNLFYIVYIGYNVRITREREWWKAVTTEWAQMMHLASFGTFSKFFLNILVFFLILTIVFRSCSPMAHPRSECESVGCFTWHWTHGPTLAPNASRWAVFTLWLHPRPTLASNASRWAVLTHNNTQGPTLAPNARRWAIFIH